MTSWALRVSRFVTVIVRHKAGGGSDCCSKRSLIAEPYYTISIGNCLVPLCLLTKLASLPAEIRVWCWHGLHETGHGSGRPISLVEGMGRVMYSLPFAVSPVALTNVKYAFEQGDRASIVGLDAFIVLVLAEADPGCAMGGEPFDPRGRVSLAWRGSFWPGVPILQGSTRGPELGGPLSLFRDRDFGLL